MSIIVPRAHQVDFSHFHNRTGPYASMPMMMGSQAWHGMGLGKTLESLWEARKQLHETRYNAIPGVPNKFLVICPKSAVPTWHKECSKNTPDIYKDMLIYPYSQIHNLIHSIKYFNIKLIIWDESHTLKEPTTARIGTVAKLLEELSKHNGRFEDGRLIQLTGTSMPNGAQEWYTSWAMCTAPDIMEASKRIKDLERYEKWKMNFAKKKAVKFTRRKGSKFEHEETKHQWSGVDNADYLQKLLTPFVHFRRVQDCIDLPEKQEVPIDLGMPEDKLLKDANIEEPEAYMALLAKLAEAKTPHMIQWVDDFIRSDSGEQLIVFAMYRHPLETLMAKFPDKVRMITGSETGAVRAQNEKDFQDGKFQVLAMTFKAGSEALNFQNCSKTLYLGYPWTDATLQQAMARTYRQGQLKKTMHYFLTSGINDMRILDIVLRKADATDTVQNLLLAKQGIYVPENKIIVPTEIDIYKYY